MAAFEAGVRVVPMHEVYEAVSPVSPWSMWGTTGSWRCRAPRAAAWCTTW